MNRVSDGDQRYDTFLASAVALVSGVVYLRTAYPSVGGGGDAVKFQYLGAVLGTAHPPGYPLYVVISHLFSRLAIGPVAYRINVMSACFGSLTAAVVYLICRRLGARRPSALGASLAAAFGLAFWSKAVVAEVYTLNAALFAAIILTLLVWRDRRGKLIYVAVVLFALAIGNHLTIVFTAPAMIAYVLLVDWRSLAKPRTLVTSAAIVLAGLAQYLFILVRTRQHAEYLEARATTVAELIDVVRARRFSYEIGSFGWHALLFDRVPTLVAAVRDELTWAGVALAATGAIVLCRKRPRELLLLLGAAAGVFMLTMNVDADVNGFLIPIFVAVAPLTACGLDAVSRIVAAPQARRTLAAALPAALASWMFVANHRTNDHHARTFEARYLDALFAGLPAKTALVSEDYAHDQLLYYKLAAEQAAHGRDIRVIPRDIAVVQQHRAAGFTILAWPQATSELSRQGVQFTHEPLFGVPLWQHLGELRRDWITVVAAPAGTLREWPIESVDVIRAPPDPRDQSWRTSPVVFATISGTFNGVHSVDAHRAVLEIHEGDAIGGRRSPASFRAEASERAAAIALGDREVVATTGEIAVMVLTDDGRLAETARVDSTEHLRVPFTEPDMILSRVTSVAACAEIGNAGWQDVTVPFSAGRLRVQVDNYRPFESRFDAFLFADAPLRPALVLADGPAPPSFAADAPAADAVEAVLRKEGVSLAGVASHHVHHVSVGVNDAGQQAAFVLEPHGPVIRAVARATVDRDNPKRVVVCGYPLGDPLVAESAITAHMSRYFGSGWHDREGEGADAFRWTSAADAELAVPLADPWPTRVTLEAMPLAGQRDATISVVVNGESTPPQALLPGWHEYAFDPPRTAWLTGLNQIIVRAPHLVQPPNDARRLGVAVRRVQVAR